MSTNIPPRHTDDDDLEMSDEHAAFLSDPPRSGQLSLFAQKLATQCFIWLASVVVFGSTADFATGSTCNLLCILSISVGVCSFLLCTLILVGQIFVWIGWIEASTFLSPSAEKHYMSSLTFLWVFGVSFLSAHRGTRSPFPGNETELIAVAHTTGLAIIFGWLAFFAAIFGTYKAYHAQKEEMKSLRYAQILSMRASEEEEYANFS